MDVLIAELARRQHSVVALMQLRELGLSARAVRGRVAAGRLHRVHTGVYAVGHPRLTREGHYMAAVLACHEAAALSYRSCAAHRGLRPDNRSVIDVTVAARRAGRERRGINAHTSRTLLRRDVEIVDGIPCTTVARTLLDLAEVLDRRGLERVCERAEILRAFDLRQVEDVLARAHGRRGAKKLAAVLDEIRPGSTLTRQDLEERFLALCRSAELPRPEVNAWIPHDTTGSEADFMWRAQRLDVELDGRDVHMTPQAFERDRLRDQQLQVQGWRVVRFTGRQLTDDPQRVAATVRALLGAPLPR
jgi:predicted transcriptional regulator of viral defense system